MESVTSIAESLRTGCSMARAKRSFDKESRDRSMLTPDKDSEILRRIADGDGEALRALYEAYGVKLYSFALRLTGSPAAAEDVLQDSLLAVWQGARGFRGESRVIAWLLGIVHHKALKAVSRRTMLSMDDESDDLPSADPLPEESTILREKSDLLRAALERLPLKHRLVLELVFYQGMSMNEAAEICGCPVGTIKSRLNHAKAGLRRMMKNGASSGEGTR